MLFSDEFQGSSSLEAHQLASIGRSGYTTASKKAVHHLEEHSHAPIAPSGSWSPRCKSRVRSRGHASSDGQPSPALRGRGRLPDGRPPSGAGPQRHRLQACPEGAAQRLCLVVNDRRPLRADRDSHGRRITPGPTVVLLGARPSRDGGRRGPARDGLLSGRSRVQRLRQERRLRLCGLSFLHPGSHSCSRSREYRPSRFILARVRIDDQGRVVGKVGHEAASPVDALRLTETTYRLSEALRMVEPVARSSAGIWSRTASTWRASRSWAACSTRACARPRSMAMPTSSAQTLSRCSRPTPRLSRGSFRSRSAGMQASVIWRLCLTADSGAGRPGAGPTRGSFRPVRAGSPRGPLHPPRHARRSARDLHAETTGDLRQARSCSAARPRRGLAQGVDPVG